MNSRILAAPQLLRARFYSPWRPRPRKLAQLPIRNDQGTYDHTPPDLSSSAAVGDYIRGRSAAWSQHVDRSKKHAAAGHKRGKGKK